VAVALCLLSAGNKVYGQVSSIVINVDERGNGTINGFLGLQPLPSSIAPDPGPGGLAAALTYNLLNPPGLVAGDLLLLEPGNPNGVLSDLIRFNPQQNGGSLVFYSDNLDGSTELADTGFPTAQYTNVLTLTEVGSEGINGFTYTPTAGQPGFVAGAAVPVTYVIASDVAAPEPSGLALCGTAALTGLIISLIRRRKRAAA
jgi:hypothetical protein